MAEPNKGDKRVYILGIGNIGKLFAHALANKPNPTPITLLLHRPQLYKDWENSGKTIEIIENDVSQEGGEYNVEPTHLDGDIISHIIVATKAQSTAKALNSIKHRISPSSTLLFLQNGMGIVDEVDRDVFPEQSQKPSYLRGITSYGLYNAGPFSAVLAGRGYVAIGSPKPSDHANYLMDQIRESSLLNLNEVSPGEFRKLQLEKLLVNSIINPLTAIHGCKNGELFKYAFRVNMVRLLLREAVKVLRSLEELKDDDEVKKRFSYERLMKLVREIAGLTANNTSSMLQDLKARRKTEIEYINGYIVKRGEQNKIDCSTHKSVVNLIKKIKLKQSVSTARMASHK